MGRSMSKENSLDKCFNILRRPSVSEMTSIIDKWTSDWSDKRLIREILSDYGWTYNEFYDEYGHRRFPRKMR